MIELYEMIFVKAQFTRICSQTQLVFTSLTCNTKKVVFSVSCFSSRLFKIHMKPVSFFCQAMNLVQSEPKLTIQIPKASFVVIPAAVEIKRAVQSLLEHYPPPTVCCLVTVHIEGTCVVGVDGIDTAFLITSFVEFGTILVNFKDMINICIAFFQPLFFDILSRFALLGCSPPILLLPRVLTTVVGRLKRGKDENSPCPYYYFFHYFYFHINTPVPDPDVGGLQKCFQPFGPQSVL